jgi:hypothetical protein
MSDKDIPQVGVPVDGKQTSDIVKEQVADGDATKATCWFNGAQLSQGAAVCSGGRMLYCQGNGSWYASSQNC